MRGKPFKHKLLPFSAAILTSILPIPHAAGQTTASQQQAADTLRKYCVTCHSSALKTAGVVIEPAALSQPAGLAGSNAEIWERAVRQLRAKTMPPVGMPRPDAATYDKVASYLETALDREAAAKPNPGDLPNLHRLTRTEYKNAIRDLLALDNLPKEMDYTLLLPADNTSSGFDNVADLLYVSPTVMERYLDTASKISRLAVGDPAIPVMVNIHQLPLEEPQNSRVEELPFGTRGGVAVRSYFPLDAEYEIQVELAGFAREPHQLEVTVDGERKGLISIGGGAGRSGRGGSAPTQFRIPVKAGPRLIGVTFVQHTEALDEATLHPRQRSRGTQPAIGAVTIRGPYNGTGPGDTPSRERIFSCHPQTPADEPLCAKQVLSTLMRRAYRRPVTDSDLAKLMPFYETGRKSAQDEGSVVRAGQDTSTFDHGVQTALERLLVSPQFLYRIERDPAGAAPDSTYRIGDLELASRLSFFLWSSIPDDELLNLAIAGKLKQPDVLEKQVRRMMADARSDSLVTNFAAQWLFLRDVEVKQPDLFLFRDFDDGLRRSFERETELFLDSILRENRSVKELLTANYTFLNERLAEHYGIPNIRGSQFRRVTFPEGSPRGGLLGQGSVLTLTSYSTRTSPVLRGKYVLENLLASPPPPPPPNVPSLKTEGNKSGEELSLREAMVQHRAQPACANCHARMDPIGFAMENFDAIGKWRDRDAGKPIDVSSKLADGTVVDGVAGVRSLILRDPERFAGAVTEKLLMYAIGRNVQYFDAPAIRGIVREAAANDYKFSDLVLGITESVPFQTRMVKEEKKP
jgi:mono/diheme cytochrome c family protein